MTKSKSTNTGMTRAEREPLERLVRLRCKNLRNALDAQGARLLADTEAKLAAIYTKEDAAWAEVVEVAEKAVEEAQKVIAESCRRRGIPESFGPRYFEGWCGRGENAFAERRAELRRVAKTEIDARVQQAKLEVDRHEEYQLTQLTELSLTSTAAKEFIAHMPSAESLVPPLERLECTHYERGDYREEHPIPLIYDLTGDANRNADVTDNGNAAVTNDMQSHKVCSHCGKALAPGRGRFCSNACRQAAYRQRSSR